MEGANDGYFAIRMKSNIITWPKDFYIPWTGCRWQALPKDLLPKSTGKRARHADCSTSVRLNAILDLLPKPTTVKEFLGWSKRALP